MSTLRYVVVLAIGQIIGWGTVGLLTVLGADIAAGLGLALPMVFAGSSVFYVTMGLCAPFLASAFIRFGARRLLIGGSAGAALGFTLLAWSQGPLTYFAAWFVLGLAGSASLSTAAHIALNEVLGARAGRAIGALMILSGLSSTIFWPITAFLSHAVGWRMVCAIYAVLSGLAAATYLIGLPDRQRAAAIPDLSMPEKSRPKSSTFYLVVASISLNAFVTFGFSGIVVELFKSMGLTVATATGLAASLGIIQVSARAIDFLGGQRWTGLDTALVAGPALVASLLLLLMLPGSSWPGMVGFAVIYGFGSGALAISRATMPLVFYDQADYARALTRIALPLNLISAASAPALIALLGRFGSASVLGVSIACSALALALLLVLNRRRPKAQPLPAAA